MSDRYAIVTDSIVENVILWDGVAQWSAPVGSVLVALNEGERCEIGQTYDSESDPRFFGSPYRPPQTWTSFAFLLRFTAQERAAFRAAALTDEQVADFQELAIAAHEVASDNPVTIQGMDYLVSVGLLTQARRDEILGG